MPTVRRFAWSVVKSAPTAPTERCVRNAANVLTVPDRIASAQPADSALTAEQYVPAERAAKTVQISARIVMKNAPTAPMNSVCPAIPAVNVRMMSFARTAISAATARRSARGAESSVPTVRKTSARDAENVPDAWTNFVPIVAYALTVPI